LAIYRHLGDFLTSLATYFWPKSPKVWQLFGDFSKWAEILNFYAIKQFWSSEFEKIFKIWTLKMAQNW